MYFISDLDKTLIYSKKENQICVERKNDKPITYMTKEAVKLLKRLLCHENFYFIPCTLRSYEQTTRIDFIKGLKYMICDNGASIYINNKIDSNWDKEVSKIINKKEVVLLKEKMETIINDNNINIYMLKSNRDSFISIIFYSKEDAEKDLEKILSIVDESKFNIFKQGKKTYVVPKGLNKSIAVKYLKEHYGIKNIITSGDSNVDDKFVELGDYQIIPSHAIFRTKECIVTENEGIEAGEELLKNVYNIVLKNN